MEAFLAQESKGAVLGQRRDRQLHRRKARQQDGAAARVQPPDRIQDAQAIDVVVIVGREGEIDHRHPVRLGFQLQDRLVQSAGHIHLQAAVGQDLAEDMLPGTVVLHDQGSLGLGHQAGLRGGQAQPEGGAL